MEMWLDILARSEKRMVILTSGRYMLSLTEMRYFNGFKRNLYLKKIF